ncbi:imm11 family protein [Pseudovibrio brasiliensis]|uniref:PLD phosphodiesterase domain-containing protein n=1 Tax=Pseudovibrio brasiliensis TaxID=1898042 RepID=A0ABX8AL95_9HYPH|nr:DUF1629 domain-containing protein [Pseudovibrio brasiliensis]QUS55814.1 hypothetical protein KGB56_21430 [Pseudovibrio brasiliensis]
MPFIVNFGFKNGPELYALSDEFEPPLTPQKELRTMLSKGRNRFDKPGEQMAMDAARLAEMPHTLYLKEADKRGLPDIISGPGGSIVVSERLKDKLEELEQGRHGFYPVVIKQKGTEKVYGTGHILYLHQKLDIIDHDNTLYVGAKNYDGPRYGGGEDRAASNHFELRSVTSPGKQLYTCDAYLIHFKPGSLEGHHLWRGTVGKPEYFESSTYHPNPTTYIDPLARTIFISDELARWILAEKIIGWDLFPILDKHVDWGAAQFNK